MKFQKFIIIFCTSIPLFMMSSDFNWEFVYSPKIEHYRSLFEKFGTSSCDICAQRQVVRNGLNSVCFVKNVSSYVDALALEIQAHELDDSDRLFIQVTFLDEVIGFMSCQIVSESKVIIQQLVLDPEKYDDSLVKDFLFTMLQLMPKIKEISVACPLFSLNFIDLFESLGFEIKDQESESDLYVQLELKIHPKCAMCQVLYGRDFWESDEFEAWDQNPDAENLPIGFYNVDDRLDNHGLPEDDDGKSEY